MKKKYYGKYRGKVVSNLDKLGLGRLEVEVPSVLNTTPVWALPCVPYAGAGVGMYMMPPLAANVWVEFEAGELSSPIWTGCFWSEGQIPQPAFPEIKRIQTDSALFEIKDIPGGGQVSLSYYLDPEKETAVSITMNAEEIKLNYMPSSITLTPESIKDMVEEVSITTTGATGVEINVLENTAAITPEAIELESGTASLSLVEEAIVMDVDAGNVTISPDPVEVNEGALSII